MRRSTAAESTEVSEADKVEWFVLQCPWHVSSTELYVAVLNDKVS